MTIDKCIECSEDPLTLCSNLQESSECYQIILQKENTFGRPQKQTCRRSLCSDDYRSCSSSKMKQTSLNNKNDFLPTIKITFILLVVSALVVTAGFQFHKMRSLRHITVINETRGMAQTGKFPSESNVKNSTSRGEIVAE